MLPDSSAPDIARIREIRAPLAMLEAQLVRFHLSTPGALHPSILEELRYVLSFSRLCLVRNEAGRDLSLSDVLASRFKGSHRKRTAIASSMVSAALTS